MAGERWASVKTIFQEALSHSGAERAAYLETACSGDDELRAAVGRLLSAHDASDGFLESPYTASAPRAVAVPDRGDVPERIGPYRIVRELGRGGMGTVYLGERDDPDLRKTVAIKVVDVGSRSILRRFRTETQILATLEHPGIARLYDAGTTETGVPYFVMEYVAGSDLLAFCDERRSSTIDRLRLFIRVCEAVQYAHQNFIVHRDLKPSNIVVTSEGDPKLLDFGIAKLASPDGETSEETVWFARALTPQYSSPEHLRGAAVTAASDVYSLGVVLYELLTGCRPYRITGRTHAEIERVLTAQAFEPPSRAEISGDSAAARSTTPEKLQRTLRGDLDNIVLKALKRDAASRYATAADLGADIQRHIDGFPVHAQPDSRAYRARKFVRRHRAGVTAACLAIASLVVGLGTAVWQAHLARVERDRAQLETAKAQQMATFLSGVFQSANPANTRGTVTARDLLDRGTASIDTQLGSSPEVQASMLLIMSDAYFRQDATQKAIDLARQALEIRQRVFPADATEIGAASYALGIMLRRAGRSAEALPSLEQALAIYEKRLKPDDPTLAQTLSSVAIARDAVGKADGTRELLERAVAIEERASPGTARLGLTYNSLATHLHRRGDLRAARIAYEHSIANYRASHEPQNWGLAMPLLNLGTLLREDEDVAAAEPLFQQALEIDEQRFGKESQPSAYALGCLGDLARVRGDFSRAHELLERALAIFAKAAPPEFHMVAQPEDALALTLLAEGRPRDALPHVEHAVKINQLAHGADSQDVAQALVDLARVRLALRQPESAEMVARRALAIQSRMLPADHRDRIPALTVLGEILVEQQRKDEARPLIEEAVRLAGPLPERHSYRLAAENARRHIG